jgi:hypothetical protein
MDLIGQLSTNFKSVVSRGQVELRRFDIDRL